MNTTTAHLALSSHEEVVLTYTEHEGDRPFLLLHGGGGPATAEAFAALLSARRRARVIVPTHHGFQGTPRPDALASVRKTRSLASTSICSPRRTSAASRSSAIR